MPELPEVETVCRSLRQTVLHQKIKIVDIYLPRLIQQPSAEEVKALLRVVVLMLFVGGESIFC